jgi:uncharacterized membrane protein YuzA (DUF378 family)
MVGGFVVTDRMLEMFKGKTSGTMSSTLYDLIGLAAGVAFILAFKGTCHIQRLRDVEI